MNKLLFRFAISSEEIRKGELTAMQQYPVPGYPTPTPGGYGAPPPPQAGNSYASPAPPQQAPLPPGMNPFRGLRRGGNQTPVSEFVGQLVRCGIGQRDNFGNTPVDMAFERVQVLQSDAPYPYPTLELGIKYSDQMNSGWGRFAESVAKALGIDLEAVEPSAMVNNFYHLVRHDDVLFFTDKNGNEARGTVWEMVSIIQPGQQVQSIRQPTASTRQTTPQQAAVAAPAPAPVQQPAAFPAPAAPVNLAQAPATQTPEARALEILNGKDTAKFFQEALPDPIVRQDPNLITAIFNNTFIQAQIAQGRVLQNPDGTHTVV